MNPDSAFKIARSGLSPLLAATLVSMTLPAGADPSATVDTSRWACKFCPADEGLGGDAELGAGYVTDGSAKFGEYTGLHQAGAYVVAGGGARYRSHDGTWLDFSLRDLGLDSRFAGLEGGQQGRYRLSLSYKETPHFVADSARSPFTGTGSGVLALPSDWVPAATTGNMGSLAANLHSFDLETRRRAVDLGAVLTPVVHWQFDVNVRHEQKTGTLGTAGSFVFNAAQLAMPVDYDTNQIDISAAYTSTRLQASVAYYGSIFRNDDETLIWSNPYASPVAGATSGELALAPSNKFHQLVASAGFEISKQTHATAAIAAGRMTQDEAFVPYTLDAGLATAPLPRSSLGGRVETLTGSLRISSAVTDKLQIDASYAYDDRDNHTPQAVYDWITADTFAAVPRMNLPYSLRHSAAKLGGRLALARDLRVAGGCDYDLYDRNFQEVRQSRELGCWGKATARATDRAEITWKGEHARRTISNYTAIPEVLSPENPLLRKYNLADRVRNTALVRVDVEPSAHVTLGLEASIARDTYTRSVLGLLDDRSGSAAADAAFSLSENTSATVFLNHEQIKSHQANAELIPGSTTWFARNNDTIDTAGAGLRHRAGDKLDIGGNYTVARSTGETSIRAATVGFPDLTTRLDSAKLYATYRLNKKLSLHLAYWYENYHGTDWTRDGVAANTVANVLSFAVGMPLYHVSVFGLSGRYEF